MRDISYLFFSFFVVFFGVGRKGEKLRVKIVHNSVRAERVIAMPAIFKIFAGIYRGISPFAVFVEIGDHLRPKQCLYTQDQSIVSAFALEELSECISDGDGEIGERIALRVALDSFLGSLEKRTRVVFMQRYFYLCPIGEIAKRNGMKASAVTMLLFRTRKKLKEHLDKEGIEL